MSQAKEILDFWFGKPDEPDFGKPRKFWFTKNSEFDQEVRSRFLTDYQQAAANQLDEWKTSPQSCLALILLLDQNSPAICFATSHKRLLLTLKRL